MNWFASPGFPPSLLHAAITTGVWIVLLLIVDPHRKEKGSTRSLLVSFLWGLSSIVVVINLYAVAPNLGAAMGSERLAELVDEVLVVGPVEEFSKFIVFFLICWRLRPVQEPLDGMLHAAMVALAFSAVENVKYGSVYFPELVIFRALLSTPMHLSYAAVWGFTYVALIYANPARRRRDYVVVFFSIFPAALIHGFSNFLMMVGGAFGFLFDLAVLTAAIVVLAVLRKASPFHAFRLDESAAALSRIELGLSARQDSYPLLIRSSLARAALGDYTGAQARLEKCLGIKAGDVFCHALSAAVLVLQGQTEKGESVLAMAYPMLSLRQKLTIRRLARHISRRRARLFNAVNEFMLSRWIADEDVR
ncbi:MAG: PrsW family intramembrane metalloprotease, partial [Acidobacteria bacterium]|nr:PrsW family intramembrane metalloprotease [Acidobacteriota bacterium]